MTQYSFSFPLCIFSFILQASEAELDPSNPDDRFFIIHEIDNGMVFVQPYHHKGGYSRLVSTLKKKEWTQLRYSYWYLKS